MKNKILVLRGTESSTVDWRSIEGAHIEKSYDELAAEFCFAIHHSRVEIGMVVFDRSIPLATFVDFLARPKRDFRGDVLFIGDDDIFISSIISGDGRILYRLSAKDLDFYLSTQLRQDGMDETQGGESAHRKSESPKSATVSSFSNTRLQG